MDEAELSLTEVSGAGAAIGPHSSSSTSKNPQDDLDEEDQQQILQPLLGEPLSDAVLPSLDNADGANKKQSLQFRSRRTPDRRRRKRNRQASTLVSGADIRSQRPCCFPSPCCGACCRSKTTLQCMNCLAKMLLWTTFISLAAAVVWYSYELFNHG